MAWASFQLGRPGYEYNFTANPEEFNPTFERLSSDQRNLVGDLKERVLRTFLPTVSIKTAWFPKSPDLDNFMGLLSITDTFLSFKTRSDWNMVLEPNLAASTTTIQIQNSSITKLSAALVAGSFAGSITINGVFAVPNGSGTNYYSGGGSYADATRTITLGSSVTSGQQLYVSYTFTGWMVRLKKLSSPISGGRVDLFNADYTLEGV